jgi:hypothetical protein
LKSAKIATNTHPTRGPALSAIQAKPSVVVNDQRILSDSRARETGPVELRQQRLGADAHERRRDAPRRHRIDHGPAERPQKDDREQEQRDREHPVDNAVDDEHAPQSTRALVPFDFA